MTNLFVPQNRNLSKSVHVSLPPEVKDALTSYAESCDMSPSEMCRQMIQHCLEGRREVEKPAEEPEPTTGPGEGGKDLEGDVNPEPDPTKLK